MILDCILDVEIVNTCISLKEIACEMAYEENQEKRIILLDKYLYLERLLSLKNRARIVLVWKEFSFKRMHEETGYLCAEDYWKYEDLWDFEMPFPFKKHEEKRQQEIDKAKKLK